MISFVYQKKGIVKCILCRDENSKGFSREELDQHLAECHPNCDNNEIRISNMSLEIN